MAARTTADTNQAELLSSFQSLRGYLSKLEKENKSLALHLHKNREERARRVIALRASQADNAARLSRLKKNLDTRMVQSQKQKTFLAKMKQFQRKNEALLQSIAQKLALMEKQLTGPGVPISNMKDELLGMLSELQFMRERRRQILETSEATS